MSYHAKRDIQEQLEAAVRASRPDDVKVLLRRGANPCARRGIGSLSPLELAAHMGDADMLTLLWEPSRDTSKLVAALARAAQRDDLRAAATLCDFGVLINECVQGERGKRPLHFARSSAMARLLLSYGAEVAKAGDFRGATPLHAAAARDLPDVVRVLAGVDSPGRDLLGRLPLQCARSAHVRRILAEE